MFRYVKKALRQSRLLEPSQRGGEAETQASDPKLLEYFNRINRTHFESFMEPPLLIWNTRLRSSAGRFTPGSRSYPTERPPKIEVATYLQHEEKAEYLIADTLAHEMIHYWLWERRRPYGHTDEFWAKMTEMGVSRYNTTPKKVPYKWVYRCQHCGEGFVLRRKFRGPRACAGCCRKHNRGRFDSRFKLVMERELSAREGLQSRSEILGAPVDLEK